MTQKKTLERVLLKIAQKIAERDIIKNTSSIPVPCVGVFHQPKRPSKSE